jgi:hypothetical protein
VPLAALRLQQAQCTSKTNQRARQPAAASACAQRLKSTARQMV